jgi:preprotein translocase subunit SecE
MDRVQVAQQSSNRLVGWFDRTRGFLTAVRDEVKKVTWPTREELIKATRMIIVLSIVLGITIGLMDLLLQVVLVEGIARLAR